MKCGLVKPLARDHLSELRRFPAVFDRIVGGVHQKRVTMPVGINLAADRPGGAMDETSPERVAGGTILVSSVDPHPGLNGRLHIVHRFPEGLVNQHFDLGTLVCVTSSTFHTTRVRVVLFLAVSRSHEPGARLWTMATKSSLLTSGAKPRIRAPLPYQTPFWAK